jgi:integrase
MAVVRKRGDFQYQAIVRKRGFPPQSRTFLHRRDAEAWARQTELAIERGDLMQASQSAQRVTIDELLTRYLSEVSPGKGQHRNEKTRIARLRAAFGRFYLSALRPLDVAAWRDLRLSEGASGQTVIHDLNMLSVVINHASREWGVHVAENPVHLIRKPRPRRPRDRRVSELEQAWLLRAADEPGTAPGLREVIVLALETSMRLSEILQLEWRRVDLTRRTVHLEETKNGESRTVALSTAAVEALQRLPRRLDGRVFHWARADSFDKPWRRCVRRAQRLFAEACAEAGKTPLPGFLENLRFHDLRHEATSRLFEKGLNPFEVASMTGHKSMQMLKRYTHVEASRLAAKLG